MTSKCICHLPEEQQPKEGCKWCIDHDLEDDCPALLDDIWQPCNQCGMLADDLNKDGYCGDCVFAGRVTVD